MSVRRAPEFPVAEVSRPASRSDARRRVPPAYKPEGRRKERKVLDAGALAEDRVDRLLSRVPGVIAWRLPGIRWQRLSGVNYIPDMAAYVAALKGLVAEQTPEIPGRVAYNVVIEVKAQHTTGSAEKKISAAITDLAYMSDDRQIVAALVLDTPALTDRQIIAFKAEGAEQAVVVLTAAEVRTGALVPALVACAVRRRRLARRVTARGRYTPLKRPDQVEQAFANRLKRRRTMQRSLRAHALTPLVR